MGKRGGNLQGSQANVKSKLILVILTLTGLSLLGLDRMYAGQVGMGVLKLITGGGFGLWFLVDGFRVLYHALTKQTYGLFGITGWSDDHEFVFKVTLGILAVQLLVSTIGGIIAAVSGGGGNKEMTKDEFDKM